MPLTDRERQVVALLRRHPTIGPDRIAEKIGTTRAAVNVHLSNLGKKGVIIGRGYVLADAPGVVVIGGANMDIKARSHAVATPGTSNPGHATMTPGGVGRNIAEDLARLGTRTHLIAAVGRDHLGDTLVRETATAGVDLDHCLRTDAATGTYTAVLDRDGELIVAVSDMAATADLLPAHIDAARDLIAISELMVLDGNLGESTLRYAHTLAIEAGVRTVIDPVSVPKAAALSAIPQIWNPDHPIFLMTPNRDELGALTDIPVDSDDDVLAAAEALHRRGVANLWIRLGAAGSLLSDGIRTEVIPSVPTEVLDVTGAGDSLLAGFCHALLQGADPVEAARFGHGTAALTIASEHTVRPDLTERLVTSLMSAAQPTTKETTS